MYSIIWVEIRWLCRKTWHFRISIGEIDFKISWDLFLGLTIRALRLVFWELIAEEAFPITYIGEAKAHYNPAGDYACQTNLKGDSSMPDPNDDQPTFSNDKWHGSCDVTVQFEILNDDRLVRTTSEHTFDVTNDHVDGTFSAEYKHVIEKKITCIYE